MPPSGFSRVARRSCRKPAASNLEQLIFSCRQLDGLLLPLCLRMMCSTCTSSLLFCFFLGGSSSPSSPQECTVTFFVVLPLLVPHFSIFATTSFKLKPQAVQEGSKSSGIAADDLPKDHVLAVQVGRRLHSDKEPHHVITTYHIVCEIEWADINMIIILYNSPIFIAPRHVFRVPKGRQATETHSCAAHCWPSTAGPSPYASSGSSRPETSRRRSTPESSSKGNHEKHRENWCKNLVLPTKNHETTIENQ